MGAGFILSMAISSAVVFGIWTGFGTYFAASPLIATWVGFVGSTSYFTAGGSKNGFIRSICSNLMGILIGMTIIVLSTTISSSVWFSALCTGFFTGVICYLAHCDLTKVIPCTFMGGFSAFATGGNWKMLLVCLIIGNLLGLVSDYFGRLIYKTFFEKNKDKKQDWVIVKILQD